MTQPAPKPRLKKGMRLRYVGPSAPGVSPDRPPGVVVMVSHARRLVTVQFDDGLFADWRFDHVEPVDVEHG